MLIVRPAEKDDFSALESFAQAVKHQGLTTLPSNTQALMENLENSIQSFQNQSGNLFWFVLEDKEQQQVVGCSAIRLHVGRDQPFYSYKMGQITQSCQALNIVKHHQILNLVNDYQDVTEIGTLYLNPDYRGQHAGKLLSRARFLFMAQFPQLFSDRVIADLRGYLDAQGYSPFWKCLGQQFFRHELYPRRLSICHH